MSEIRDDLKYTQSHEWLRDRGDGTVEIGITDHAQDALGELVYVETTEAGTRLDAGETCATVESVKSASDVYTPVAGEIVDANTSLADSPEKVNNDPYGEGWLTRIRAEDAGPLDNLMDAAAYRDYCEQGD
ncbi:MAG TPA: glycine cleavage system protein GcvH [Gammaproteobacteria bacterium]|nr:glycine cleavage system protein GcvH [Gammaproteobacteria bacterium]